MLLHAQSLEGGGRPRRSMASELRWDLKALTGGTCQLTACLAAKQQVVSWREV